LRGRSQGCSKGGCGDNSPVGFRDKAVMYRKPGDYDG